MFLADRSTLKGFVTKPVKFQLGQQVFHERLYVAPGDEMLLGHDLLRRCKALLDLHSDCLVVNGESIPLVTSSNNKTSVISRVTISKRTVIPPNSAVRLKCNISEKLKEFFFEPVENNLGLLVPSIVCSANENPIVCFVNPTEKYRTLKKGCFSRKCV